MILCYKFFPIWVLNEYQIRPKNIDVADLCCVARVCKMFARASSVDVLWVHAINNIT